MFEKSALIVDDSRSARLILTRLLKKHKLNVDSAASAEEALAFLNDHRPDVIFMDHMMPGMDGFQAVQAIKNNPRTATIPIMMYTSQSGDLYVGQARALGAIGVLPKQTRPVEISRVLKSLNLVGDGAPPPPPPPAPAQVPGSKSKAPASRLPPESVRPSSIQRPEVETSSERRLKEFLDRRLRGQSTELKRELMFSIDRLSSRLSENFSAQLESLATRVESQDRSIEEEIPTRSDRSWLPYLVVPVLLALGFYLGVAYQGRQVSGSTRQLATALDRQQEINRSLSAELDARSDPAGAREHLERLLLALQWGVNQRAEYAFGDMPMGDERAIILGDLVGQLDDLGFSGSLRVQTHVGDFCVVEDPVTGYRLAPPDLPVEACASRALAPAEALLAGERQSVQFANLLSGLSVADNIDIEIISFGNSSPVEPYPANSEGMLAGDWNQIARRNNRVEIFIIPGST